MVLVPPIKSSLNALVDCISHCFAQEGQGHVKIGIPSCISFLKLLEPCFCLQCAVCLDSTSVHKSRYGHLVLKGAFCISNMSDLLAHVSPWLCTYKVSFNIFIFLCAKFKKCFLPKVRAFETR